MKESRHKTLHILLRFYEISRKMQIEEDKVCQQLPELTLTARPPQELGG